MDSEPRIQLKQFIKEVLSEEISKKVRGSSRGKRKKHAMLSFWVKSQTDPVPKGRSGV